MEDRNALPSLPHQWRPVLETLFHTLQTKHSQLLFLTKERKVLEDRINLMQNIWSQDVQWLKHRLEAKDRTCNLLKLDLNLECARADLLMVMKEKDVFLYKTNKESAEAEMEKLKSCIDQSNDLSRNKEGVSTDNHVDEALDTSINAENELKKLRQKYKHFSNQKSAEIAALLSERNFVWNQLKEIEDGHLRRLDAKSAELVSAKEKIDKLEHAVEILQSEINEKDIENLNRKVDVFLSCSKGRETKELIEPFTVPKSTRNEVSETCRAFLVTGEVDINKGANIPNKTPNGLQETDKDDHVEEGPADELFERLREMSKQMELKQIENENLRMLCSELENQLNKFKNPVKKGENMNVAVSRNLMEELRTVVSDEIVSEHHKVVASQPLTAGEGRNGRKTPKPQNSRKRTTRNYSSMDHPRLFSSAFKVPKVKDCTSVVIL